MIFLASKSPRRREMLENLGVSFEVVESSFEEVCLEEDYLKCLKINACGKAENTNVEKGIVLGIDTFGVLNGNILEKPKDRKDAFSMVKKLSGNTHIVISGVCFYDVEKNTTEYFTVSTDVTFFSLSDAEIEEYLDTGEYEDKAAAYGIQGYGRMLVKEIQGDFWNVVGFPVKAVRRVFSTL